jgi:hypothetical protein
LIDDAFAVTHSYLKKAGIMEQLPNSQEPKTDSATPEWLKPEIVSFLPAKAAEGIRYRPSDGISNLT